MSHTNTNTNHLFQPGQSGNPNGRPKGTKNKSTELREQVTELLLNDLHGEAKDILQVALEKAKGGDRVLLKFFLERFLPAASVSGDASMDPSRGNIQIIVSPMQPPSTIVEGETIEETKEYDDKGSTQEE